MNRDYASKVLREFLEEHEAWVHRGSQDSETRDILEHRWPAVRERMLRRLMQIPTGRLSSLKPGDYRGTVTGIEQVEGRTRVIFTLDGQQRGG